MAMRKWLILYFSFSRREYNGLLVMIFIIGLVYAFPAIYGVLVPEHDDLVAEAVAIRKLSLVEEKKDWAAGRRPIYKGTAKARLFAFDPNKIGAGEWQSLGLSPKQAAVMLRYRAKGGLFHKKEDVKKMYPISAELYAKLEPYIKISDTDSFKGAVPHRYVAAPRTSRLPVVVMLNSADTNELQQVKGIGPAFARRIVKYRERLGGFYKKEQLMEVYGLDSIRYQGIAPQVNIDLQSVKKIFINSILFDDLKLHPYLSFKEVNAILQYRKQHGNYSNIADLKKVAILNVEKAERLAPYISFDHD